MSFMKKIRVSIIFAMVITTLVSTVSFAKTSEKIRNDVLRLHVLANSDSEADQSLKLAVRDAVLASGMDIFDGSVNIDNALERIAPKMDEIQKTARRVILENGYDYPVRVYLKREYFTTRTYENVTLPAGQYLALRIIIGSGEGHNWWCVMFPPMCLPAAKKRDVIGDVLDRDEERLVEKNPKYEIRFKIVEIIEGVKSKIYS